MAQIVTLTTPIVPATRTVVHIQRITLDVDAKAITVEWVGNDGVGGVATYPTTTPPTLNPLGQAQPSGATLLTTLNTSNLTSNSLINRTILRLQTDGYIPAGSVSGTPD